MKSLSSPQKFIHGLRPTKFKEDVDVFMVFEEMVEANNMLVGKRSVNFDLRQKLLACSALCKRTLGNVFPCEDLSVCDSDEFIALGKTSFAEKRASYKLLNLHFSIYSNLFVFNYYLAFCRHGTQLSIFTLWWH